MATLETELFKACRNGDFLLAGYLLRLGARVNHRDVLDPLSTAVLSGHIKIVDLLLKAGANVHIDDEYPLRMAVENYNIPMIELLLNAGANAAVCVKYINNNYDWEHIPKNVKNVLKNRKLKLVKN